MKVAPITSDELPAYDDLARQYGTLFSTREWLALFDEKMQTYAIFDKGQRLIGGFALYHERRWGLKVIRRPPFTPTVGPFYKQLASNPVAQLEEQRKILSAVVGHLEQLKSALCMVPLPRGLSDALPFFWRDYKVIPGITYLIDLDRQPDELWRNMSGTRRNDIRKAQRDGLIVERAEALGVVRDLVVATFERQKKWVDREMLDAILFNFSKPENSFAFVAFRNRSPVAASFVVHDGSTAYYLLGGYRSDQAHHGAGAWALWEAIQYAQSLGIRTFDFEGSVIPAIEHYFRGFGGKPTMYLTINKAWFPIEYGLKLFKRNRF